MSRRGTTALGICSLLLTSCLAGSSLTGPAFTPKEDYIAERVDYYSKALNLDMDLRVVFTQQRQTWGCTTEQVMKGCYDFGWYQAGTTYFYRPAVEAAEWEYLSDAACHEAAHHIWPFHDSHHWCACQKLGATPTYDLTGVPGGRIVCR